MSKKERIARLDTVNVFKTMRLEGIDSIEAGNAFLECQYLTEHNCVFATLALWFPLTIPVATILLWGFWLSVGIRTKGE